LAPRAPHPASASDLLLDALALHSTEGTAAAAPTLRQAINAFCGRAHPLHEELDWLSLACAAASLLWDNESWRVLAARHVQITRDRGALNMLPLALNGLASYRLLSGDLGAASSMIAEARTINEVTGSNYTSPFVAMNLAALRGGETDALALIEASIQGSPPGGQGNIVRFAQSATATLYNGLARYDLALTAAENACHHMSNWGTQTTLPELIEAAVRNGTPERASAAFDELSGSTMASGTDWALGIRARSCGLLGKDGGADDSYREALRYLSATGLGTEIARTHLLYGEWLRRERRRLDAREQLRTAHEMFTTMGADGFAERARIELVATGETARKRVSETSFELTAQEAQVCRFAADGSTNAEIAARLFISANTVDYHLRKAFRKLGVKSRTQLAKELVK
jgi:DNA-binding CsgD family transcriptional regulator